MGWGIVGLFAFVVLAALLVIWALVARRTRRRTALDEWKSASLGDLSRPPAPNPANMFDPGHGFGGIENHHGNQRPFGGYGSDTEPRKDAPPRGERPPDDRSRGAAA